ncbi:MAG: hypothetical protein IJS45_06695 [Clostridia bacterium]|nr:hypothetical protein [Clostridia bacterium]
MTPFFELSPPVRSAFAFWALALCLFCIFSAALAAVKKRYRFTAFALILSVPVYFAWQVIFDLSLSVRSGAASAVSRDLGGTAWIWWAVIFAALTALSLLLLGYNIRYDKTFITPGAIKLFLDKIPCGVCCWRDNGRVLFSNVCMNRLCVALTGSPLLNGKHFGDAVADGIFDVDGKVWRFSFRDFVTGGETLHELIASDVTAEYAKTQALEKDKAELSRLNGELKEYTLSIDDTVRHQEILQAKVNIHDEMNRLMLSTTAAEGDDTAGLDRIFSLWEKNALLLCMEAGDTADEKAAEGVEALAAALKIRLVWCCPVPDALTDKQKSLFYTAAKEAVINAVKHASAKEINISFDDTDNSILCHFTNGGDVQSRDVCFTGGLLNLSRLAAKQGASVTAEAGEKFTLTLTYKK